MLHSHKKDFQLFYEKNFDRVYAFFSRRARHTEDAKDLTQDVFTKAYQNWQQLEKAENPKAYLFTIARNTLIDYFRKSLIQENIEMANLSEQAAFPSSPDAEFSDDQIRMLHQSIESLPEQRRKIIKLKKLQGLTTEEIAEELSLSKRTVDNQVYRAMAALRKRLANLFSMFF